MSMAMSLAPSVPDPDVVPLAARVEFERPRVLFEELCSGSFDRLVRQVPDLALLVQLELLLSDGAPEEAFVNLFGPFIAIVLLLSFSSLMLDLDVAQDHFLLVGLP